MNLEDDINLQDDVTHTNSDDEVIADLVNEQAEDEGLWFVAQTAPEAYLQQELRRLHAAIETRIQQATERGDKGD